MVANPGAPLTTSMLTDPLNVGRLSVTVQVVLLPQTTEFDANVTLAIIGGTTSTDICRLLPAYWARTGTNFGWNGICRGSALTVHVADVPPTGRPGLMVKD